MSRAVPILLRRATAFWALILGVMAHAQVVQSGSSPWVPLGPDVVFWHRMESASSLGAGSGSGFSVSGVEFVPGRVGRAMALGSPTPSGLWFEVSSPQIDPMAISIEGWIQRRALTLVSESPSPAYLLGGGGPGSLVFTMDARGRLALGIEGGNWHESSRTVSDLDWHHVAAVKAGPRLTFYIDGQPAGTSEPEFLPAPGTFYSIGAKRESPGVWRGSFRGAIDEMALHRVALPGSYFEQVYAAGKAGKRVLPALDVRLDESVIVLTNAPFVIEAELRNPSAVEATNVTANISRSSGIRFRSGTASSGLVSVTDDSVAIQIASLPAGGRVRIRLEGIAGEQPGGSEIRLRVGGHETIGVVGVVRSCEVLPGVVGRWPMDGTGVDVIGGAVGTLRGGASWVAGPEGRGQVLKVDGGAQALVVADPVPLGLDVFSLELRFRRGELPLPLPGASVRVIAASSSGSYSVAHDAQGQLLFSQVEQVAGTIPAVIADKEWHHLVLVREPGLMVFYYDGIRVGATEFTGSFGPSQAFAFGGLARPVGSTYSGFVGLIDEARVYNRALGAEEVQDLAQDRVEGGCLARASVEALAVPEGARPGTTNRMVVRVRNTGMSPLGSSRVLVRVNPVLELIGGSGDGQSLVLGDGSGRLDLASLLPGESREVAVDVRVATAGFGVVSVDVQDPSAGNAIVGRGEVRFEAGRDCVGSVPGLVGWYRGEGSARNSAGSGDGITGAGVGFGPGRVGMGFQLDGTDGVDVPAPAGIGGAFTVEAWVRPTSLAGAEVPIIHFEAAGPVASSPGFGLAIRGNEGAAGGIPVGNLVLEPGGLGGVVDDGGGLVDARAAIRLGEWTHVALTVSAGRVRTFVNGVLTREMTGLTGTVGLAEAGWRIGARHASEPNPGAVWFRGGIDEVGVYERELTAAEVAALYAAGGAGRCTDDLAVTWEGVLPGLTTGESMVARMRIENRGGDAVAGIVLTNPVPAGWSVLALTTSAGTATLQGGQVRAELGSLPAGGAAFVDVTFTTTTPGVAVLEVSLSGGATEAVTANNVARTTVVSGPAVLGVSGASFGEALSGDSHDVDVEIRLSSPVSRVVTVNYSTGEAGVGSGLPAAQAGTDYLPRSGAVVFQPGETVRKVPITVVDDATFEGNESFTIRLSDAEGAGIDPQEAVLVLVDNDPVPAWTIDDVVVREGTVDQTEARVRIRLDRPSAMDVSMTWQTLAGTAQAPQDYIGQGGIFLVPAGVTEAEIRISVVPDAEVEPNEYFRVEAGAAPGSEGSLRAGGRSWAAVTLVDDDRSSAGVQGFEWVVPVSGTAGVALPVELRAVDAQGQVVPTYQGPVTISARPAGSGTSASPILLTEVFVEGIDGVELQNVSGGMVDATGWRLSFYDHSTWPVPVRSLVLPAGTMVPPGGVFRVVEGGDGPGGLPSFHLQGALDWGTDDMPAAASLVSGPIAVLLQRPQGTAADFFSAFGGSPGNIEVPLSIDPADWPGLPFPGWSQVGYSAQRTGSDAGGTSRWELCRTTSAPLANLWIRTPFDGTLRGTVGPSSTVELVNGRWSGSVTVQPVTRTTLLVAADPGGNIGVSAPVDFAGSGSPLRMGSSTDAGLLAAMPAAQTFRWSVTNTGPVAVRDVALGVAFDPGFGLTKSHILRITPSQGVVDHPGVVEDGTYQLRARFGILDPGAVASFTLLVDVTGKVPELASRPGGVLHVLAELSRQGSGTNWPADRQRLEVPFGPSLVPHTAGMVAWWRGEGDGTDSAGAHNGVLDGVGFRARGDVRAFSFDGQGSVTVPDHPGLRPGIGRYWGVSAWIRARGGGPDRMVVVEKTGTGIGDSVAFTLSQGRPAIEWAGQTFEISGMVPDLRDGEWHIVSWMVRPARDRAYVSIDETLDSWPVPLPTLPVASPAVDGPLRIGVGFFGELDEVCLYNTLTGGAPTSGLFLSGALGRPVSDLRMERLRAVSPSPVAVVGRPFLQSVRISNVGFQSSSTATLVFSTPEGVPIVGVRRDGEAAEFVAGPSGTSVVLGVLPAGQSTEIEWTSMPSAAAYRPTGASLAWGLSLGAGIRDRTSVLNVSPMPLTSDADGDGIGDSWEGMNGLDSRNPNDATEDPDGDGFTNRAEYEAGTKPRDGASFPGVIWQTPEDDVLVLQVLTTPDRDYMLERNGSVVSGAGWISMERRPGTGSTIGFRVVLPVGEDAQFYRVRPIPRW